MKLDIQDDWIDRVGMSAIVLVSLGYVLFGNSFAQLRLEFSFLNFPIFIGEILLGFTLLLFLVKSLQQKQELGLWGWVLGAYLIFILIKAFFGYFKWGPLAFRDAALFYYLFFAVLGYSFWSPDLWGKRIRHLFLIVILSIFILRQFNTFWPFTLIIIALILAMQAKNSRERMISIGGIVLLAPYEALFNVYLRTVFLSSLITIIFTGIVFFLLFCKKKWVRFIGMGLGVLILGAVILFIGKTGVWSTFKVESLKPGIDLTSQNIQRGKYLFHPVGISVNKPDSMKEFIYRLSQTYPHMGKTAVVKEYNETLGMKKSDLLQAKKTEIIIDKKYDTLFRLYIWRDMLREYAWYKPLFGFDFGRPLCSLSLVKYYGMASTQYTDGWVGAHNSFFYMIYRAGIVGLVMVLSLLFLWFGLLRDFYILRDWVGLLLCGIMLDWIVSANFFLIFELPYTAIPVWLILGITLKHRMLTASVRPK